MATKPRPTAAERREKVQKGYLSARTKTVSLWKDLVNLITQNTQYFVMFEFVVLAVIWVFIYRENPLHVTNRYPVQTILIFQAIVFVMLMGAFYVQWRYGGNTSSATKGPQEGPPNHNMARFMYRSGLFLVGLAAMVLWADALGTGIEWVIPHDPTFTDMVGTFSKASAFVVALAAIYLFFGTDIQRLAESNTFFSFLKHLVFYLPCLLIDAVNYAKEQWNITTDTVWIVLGIEILFIFLYYVGPYVITWLTSIGTQKLLRDPVYLDTQTGLGPFQGISSQDIAGVSSKKHKNVEFNYNFSLSAWFRLNPQPPSSSPAYMKYTNILSFGNKPRIEFYGLQNRLRIRTGLGNGKQLLIYTTQDVPLQKWNYLVINYYGGTMDVFLNGVLVGSRPNVAPCMSEDNVVAGEKDGIQGGICNVTYHPRILSKPEILTTYKLLSGSQPPVV